MIYNIFKIPIWHKNFSLNLNLDNIEKSCLNIQKNNQKRFVSNLGGFQSDLLNLNNYPEFYDLAVNIIEEAKLFCNEININQIKGINGIWVNINEYGHSNSEHHHPNCVLSGVFYAHSKLNNESGSIVFKHPSADTMAFNWAKIQKEVTSNNTLDWLFSPVPGDLIIFPSWLKHSVRPNLVKDYKRISISFNLS
jgi:uncharacterized protein (TIGR02466 family)